MKISINSHAYLSVFDLINKLDHLRLQRDYNITPENSAELVRRQVANQKF